MPTIDDFLGGYKAPQVVVSLCSRADLVAQHELAERRLTAALRDSSDDLAGSNVKSLREEIFRLEDEMEATTVPFHLEALPSQEYRQLMSKHTPRQEDKADGYGFNRETFPPVLLSRCCVDPVMSEDKALQLFHKLSDGQFAKLWNALLMVNIGDDQTPKSVRPYNLAGASGRSSSTASPSGSLAQSSSDE